MKMIFLFLCLILPSCSYVKYQRGDVTVTGIEFGTDKALSGFHAKSDQLEVSVDSMDSNQTNGMQQINQFVQSIVQGAIKGAKP